MITSASAEHYIEKSMPDFWKILSCKFKRNITNNAQFQGCTSNVDLANAFARHFSSVYGQSGTDRPAEACLSQLENEVSRQAFSVTAIPTLSVEMIEDVINSMKLGKACGPDNPSVEHLKYSHVIILDLSV